jgi:hypothetical protein
VPVPELVFVPVEPDWLLGAVAVGVAVTPGVGVGVALPLALPEVSRLGSLGIETSTGPPGTSW